MSCVARVIALMPSIIAELLRYRQCHGAAQRRRVPHINSGPGGHVGCCDDSPNRHATRHFHATQDPIIEGYDPPEGCGSWYVDEMIEGVPLEFLLTVSQGCVIGLNFVEAPANFSRFLSGHAAMFVKFHGVICHVELTFTRLAAGGD